MDKSSGVFVDKQTIETIISNTPTAWDKTNYGIDIEKFCENDTL